jgi:dTDP-4-amino-4,6-dideoxygalactose transaminase
LKNTLFDAFTMILAKLTLRGGTLRITLPSFGVPKTQGITFRQELEYTRANYWLMCVELENLEERNVFLKATNDAKAMTRPIWQLMYRLPMYQHCYRDDQKNAEYLEERIVNIPSSVRI